MYDSLTMLELTICKKIVTEMFLSQTHLLRSLHYFAALLRVNPISSAVCCVVWVVLTVKWRVGVWAPSPQTSRWERISNQQPGKRGILSTCAVRSRREESRVGFWFSTINMSRVQNRKAWDSHKPWRGMGGKSRRSNRTAIAERALFFHVLKCRLENLRKRFLYKAHVTLIGKWCCKNYKGSNCIFTSCMDSQGRQV